MEKERYFEYINNSMGLMHIEMLLVGNAQGLGILDVELIEEFPKLKINSQLEEDRLKKLRHITLSELWVMGAYELIRFINERLPKPTDIFSEGSIEKIKGTKRIFEEVRVPLVKFQKRHEKRLFSGVVQPNFDSIKGMGWKIHLMEKAGIETKIIYRKDLGDLFLELLKEINNNVLESVQ